MTDAPRTRPQCDTQRQSPTTSLAHRTRRAPSSPHHARRQFSPSAGPRDGSASAVSANANAAGMNGANHADEDDDDDYTSSSGSDSDSASEGDSENENARRLDTNADGDVKSHDGDGMPRISGRAKPRIHRVEGDNGLMARLSAFLPQMKTANEDLQREIDAGRGMELRLDEVDEQKEGRYIEMNLGLGVLEEQHSDDEDTGEKSEAPTKDSESRAKTPADSNVMDTLMGNEDSPSSKKPTIQEL